MIIPYSFLWEGKSCTAKRFSRTWIFHQDFAKGVHVKPAMFRYQGVIISDCFLVNRGLNFRALLTMEECSRTFFFQGVDKQIRKERNTRFSKKKWNTIFSKVCGKKKVIQLLSTFFLLHLHLPSLVSASRSTSPKFNQSGILL